MAETGLACPGYGLALRVDVDNAILRHLAAGSDMADRTWEALRQAVPWCGPWCGPWLDGRCPKRGRASAHSRTAIRNRLTRSQVKGTLGYARPRLATVRT